MATSMRGAWLEVRQLWGEVLLDTRHFKIGESVSVGNRVGPRWYFLGVDMGFVPEGAARFLPYLPPIWSEIRTERRTDFHVPMLGPDVDPVHTLFQAEADGWALDAPMGWEHEGDLEAGLGIDAGTTTFLVRRVERAPAMDRRGLRVEAGLAAFSMLFAFAAILFAVVVWATADTVEVAVLVDEDRVVEMMILQPPAPEPEPEVAPLQDAPAAAKDNPRKSKRPDKAKGKAAKRKVDVEAAMGAGVLGAWDQLAGALEGDSMDVLRAAADGLIVAKGAGGHNPFGGGGDCASNPRACGGTASGLEGGIGTIGGPGGIPGGYGPGGPGKTAGRIAVPDRGAVLIGSLSASDVDDAIKRRMNQIRYCYQRELQRDASLGGKVVVHFVIAADGTVSSARVSQSTMDNASVERCLEGRFLKIQFPEPMGGGIVSVKYPLIFTPG